MVKLSKLYTRQGDKGTTYLLGGVAIEKESLRVEAYGSLDELNSWCGMVRAFLDEHENFHDLQNRLKQIQHDLFDIGSELATPPSSDWTPPTQVQSSDIAKLENDIDTWSELTGELRSFLLPGGSQMTSSVHITRTVCRRAERVVCALHREFPVRSEVLIYINRLSDWLFAAARFIAHTCNEAENLWEINRTK
ncbi:MAG: cob(I)yrinic acid a,c-diamide adenosyltransferase [Bdellovibrionales bacterium]|nr:cob(I)yrinic acid a,c-diamide adenosyltransferase [Bdellovibrionales bacterium]